MISHALPCSPTLSHALPCSPTQIAEEKRIKLTVEAGSSMFSLGHNAVSFTINRAAHLLPRGLGGYYKETLTIGEKCVQLLIVSDCF